MLYSINFAQEKSISALISLFPQRILTFKDGPKFCSADCFYESLIIGKLDMEDPALLLQNEATMNRYERVHSEVEWDIKK